MINKPKTVKKRRCINDLTQCNSRIHWSPKKPDWHPLIPNWNLLLSFFRNNSTIGKWENSFMKSFQNCNNKNLNNNWYAEISYLNYVQKSTFKQKKQLLININSNMTIYIFRIDEICFVIATLNFKSATENSHLKIVSQVRTVRGRPGKSFNREGRFHSTKIKKRCLKKDFRWRTAELSVSYTFGGFWSFVTIVKCTPRRNSLIRFKQLVKTKWKGMY